MTEARLIDQDALQARSPVELAMYLRAREWQITKPSDTHVLWTKIVDGDEYETRLPTDSTFRDYASRVHDLLETLAIVEGRSELAVLRDICHVSMDGHYIRTFPVDSSPGMIGLDDGVTAYESMRNLVVAAACAASADSPKAVQPTRKPTEVLKLVRETQFGPASEGSFILSVHIPVPPRLTEHGQASLFEDGLIGEDLASEPYERRVSLKLHEAVHSVLLAANATLVEADSLRPFTSAIKRGVSANLCEALVGLGGEGAHPFEIRTSLALTRPSRTSLPSLRFRRDHLSVIYAAAQEFRARLPEEDVLVTGDVVRLHREASESGEVSIAGTIEGEGIFRRVWVDLTAEDYQKATEAHKRMARVSVRGDLIRRGNKSYLLHAHAFEVKDIEES